jgi:hypothetical protein
LLFLWFFNNRFFKKLILLGHIGIPEFVDAWEFPKALSLLWNWFSPFSLFSSSGTLTRLFHSPILASLYLLYFLCLSVLVNTVIPSHIFC